MYIMDTVKVGNFNLLSFEGLSCERSTFDIKNVHLFNAILIFLILLNVVLQNILNA